MISLAVRLNMRLLSGASLTFIGSRLLGMLIRRIYVGGIALTQRSGLVSGRISGLVEILIILDITVGEVMR